MMTLTVVAQDKSEVNNTKHDVTSIVKELFSMEWYQNQEKLWKKEVESDKKNAKAWYNYYMAARAIRNLEKDNQKKEELDKVAVKIAFDAYEAVPKSFEGNILKYKGSQYDEVKYLYKAYEINPNDKRTYQSMMIEAELLTNVTEREKFANLMFQNNMVSSGILNWGYNLLAGLDSNAIIITHGDNDTYGAYLNQAGNNFRKDVLVLNSYMLMKDEYRKKIFQKLGMEDQFEPSSDLKSMENWEAKMKGNIKKLIEHSNRSFYVTNTNDEKMFGGYKDDFYLTGLNYKYSKSNLDNTSIIRNNVENKYKLDYLDVSFAFDISQRIVERSHGQYLASFIKLHNHYRLSGENDKATKLKQRILKIAKLNNLLDQVQKQLAGKC